MTLFINALLYFPVFARSFCTSGRDLGENVSNCSSFEKYRLMSARINSDRVAKPCFCVSVSTCVAICVGNDMVNVLIYEYLILFLIFCQVNFVFQMYTKYAF